MQTLRWSSLLLLPALVSCDDKLHIKTGGETPPEGEGWCGVQAIFEAECLSCHGAAALGDLDLSGDAHAAIVGQPSAADPAWTLVVPGDPGASLLYRKAAGTQEADQGTEMPPGSGLDAASLAVLEQWIADGATDVCAGGETGSPDADHHPDGYFAPEIHGAAAKQQEEECADCHGADLADSADGSIPSCDTCHTPDDPQSWRTDCVFCHGGQDNLTGAPPLHISGQDDGQDATFLPHTVHVEETDAKVALACTQCHVLPSDVLSLGHLFLGDDTAGRAEVDFSAGLSPATTWSGGTCGNSYCHGNGRGNNGSIAHTAGERECDDCHAGSSSGGDRWEGMSGEHKKHLEEGLQCVECHSETLSSNTAIADKALHVNGQPDVALPDGMNFNAATVTCSGSCHGESHSGRDWD